MQAEATIKPEEAMQIIGTILSTISYKSTGNAMKYVEMMKVLAAINPKSNVSRDCLNSAFSENILNCVSSIFSYLTVELTLLNERSEFSQWLSDWLGSPMFFRQHLGNEADFMVQFAIAKKENCA